MEPRAFLRALFDAAVAAADPAVVLPAHLPEPPRGRTIVVGAGKASAAMGLALERHWPGELSGLIVTRYGHGAPCQRIEVVEAAHHGPPQLVQPGPGGLVAAEAEGTLHSSCSHPPAQLLHMRAPEEPPPQPRQPSPTGRPSPT